METRLLQLISALRSSGVRVSLAESTEAFSAVDLIGIHDRERFRLSLRATLVKDVRHLPVFDRLFPLFFGTGALPEMGGHSTGDLTPTEAQMLAESLHRMTDNLRRRLERLMSGEPLSQSEMESLGRLVGLNQTGDLRHQEWMAQRMMRALAFPEVRKAVEELISLLAQMGMESDRAQRLRARILKNMQGIEQQIRQFAGARIAENLSEEPPSERLDRLMNQPFHALSDAEWKLLQREVKRLAAALRTRIALRQKRAKSGQLDPKATIRANLKYHGVPMELRYRDRMRKPKLVALCDLSTSMRFCSGLMLNFLFALQGQVHKTHAFAFIDHLEYISNYFIGSNSEEAMTAVLYRMPSGYYNTDLGYSLSQFENEYMDILNGGTTLIVVGDGRNNYNDPHLEIFSTMARRATRTIWLNPEPPALWHGDSDMPRYAPICDDVLKVGNLRELTSAVDALLAG